MPKQKARTSATKASTPRHHESSRISQGTSANHSEAATAPTNGHVPGASLTGAAQSTDRSAEIAEKVKELVRLAQEQGYLTYNDINDALPDSLISGEELDEVYVKLRNLEVEIVDQAEVDRIKQPEPEEEEDKQRLDILDDPVRMYLKQMGQVPLLTREQEVEISKRIEDAELMVQKHINHFGFISRAYLDLALKLQEGRERFDRVILDKKIESRERYMKQLPRLCENLEKHSVQVAHAYRAVVHNGAKSHEAKSFLEFKKAHEGLQKL